MGTVDNNNIVITVIFYEVIVVLFLYRRIQKQFLMYKKYDVEASYKEARLYLNYKSVNAANK